jgi:hypothetical protein
MIVVTGSKSAFSMFFESADQFHEFVVYCANEHESGCSDCNCEFKKVPVILEEYNRQLRGLFRGWDNEDEDAVFELSPHDMDLIYRIKDFYNQICEVTNVRGWTTYVMDGILVAGAIMQSNEHDVVHFVIPDVDKTYSHEEKN